MKNPWWWVGLFGVSTILWLAAELAGVRSAVVYAVMGMAWGALWSMFIWPALEERL